MDLASKLDTRIRIERKSATSDPLYGTETITWTTFATVWAEVQDVLPSRAERLADSIIIANRPARIRMRHLAGITADMRVIIGNRGLQIVSGPAEIGRREGIELIVEQHSSEGATP
ncbi:phage head closure protein [Sphingosinicella microcystinivorans]|uniref:phage head closure protein n=1 Tax=Sphingosinicella microcystinivorans TaxID=335406 RepID=UPI0022F390D5|nr:phage head closure protein [Sphingosinicella microcystinivorans]WBX86339.1 phage head closure protein [Sphingosinicella microcystinivorans]